MSQMYESFSVSTGNFHRERLCTKALNSTSVEIVWLILTIPVTMSKRLLYFVTIKVERSISARDMVGLGDVV